METLTPVRFRFGQFELDCSKRTLSFDGRPVELQSKTFDLLQFFVQNNEKLISKDELLDYVWPDQIVEENNLTVQISYLRKALAQGNENLITTVPGKGYSFSAKVVRVPVESEVVIENRSISRLVIEKEVEFAAPQHTAAEQARPVTAPAWQLGSSFRFLAFATIAVVLGLGLMGSIYWNPPTKSEAVAFSLRKLTTEGNISAASITPDSKYAVFSQSEREGESLWLKQISTGSKQQILPVRPIRYVGLAVSPDGDSIYATVFAANRADPELWRLPLLGGVVEHLKGITTGGAVSFSPDGAEMAFTESRSSLRETQLLVADKDGREKRVLARGPEADRSFPNFNVNPVSWSPDGKLIACAMETKKDGSRPAILLVDPVTGSERSISGDRWDQIDHLTWLDNDNIAFIADTFDPLRGQIWTASARTGEVRPVTNDLHSYSWLASSGGGLLTVQKNPVSRLAIGTINEAASLIEPIEIYRETGFVENLALTPDGRILFSSNASGRREIWSVDRDGTNRVRLTNGASVTFGITVLPNDGAIIFSSMEAGRHRLMAVDADGQNMRPLTEGPDDVLPSALPDGRSVIYQRGINNKIITLRRLDVFSGEDVQISDTHTVRPAVSDDGAKVAFYFMASEAEKEWGIGMISSQNGEFLGKLSFPSSVTERRMRWHPGGRSIGQVLVDGDEASLLMLPTDGSPPSRLSGIGKGKPNWFEWFPDGKNVVISLTEQSRDLVLLSR